MSNTYIRGNKAARVVGAGMVVVQPAHSSGHPSDVYGPFPITCFRSTCRWDVDKVVSNGNHAEYVLVPICLLLKVIATFEPPDFWA